MQQQSNMQVELLVRMDCRGCERTIRKALFKLKGVENVEVDFEQQKVTVTGYVDQMKVLRRVRKTGKAAEFWNPTQEENYFLDYVHTPSAFQKTYNYYRHGFNNIGTSHYYTPSTYHRDYMSDEDEDFSGTSYDASMFSDDNPNACHIM
ncbi:hypothetical protein GOP47_0003940 [Adiantum capillus-veneris]|uniref:HMA domain-containing protein n=1 Tax=Adiantum capillus-veneris TaxID=13818 RepID=A0A9D4V8A1_ADICA|nr:hypothetical protein GOP47_0003940 [Adiantum capillus-veneris]